MVSINLHVVRFMLMKNQYLSLVLWCLLLPLSLNAQGSQPVFEAYADAKQVLLNNYFEISFTLKNADGQNFRSPSFNDFVILSGPSRAVSTTIVNGQVSKEMSFSYTLQPRRTGKFTIPPANIQVNGKTLRTQPVTLEVLEGQSDVTEEQKFFIEAIPSEKEAYIGQQIRLDYKLFTTVDIQNYNITEESDYVGFYTEDIQRPDTRTKREIIDGVQYITKVIKSIALYPQQAGRLQVDPAVLQLGVVMEGRRSGSFFFGNEIKRVPFRTEALTIVVKSLPSNKPENFSGAVGDFNVKAYVSRNTITTDDALTLTMIIEGDGDIKRIQAPAIKFPEAFEIYEPKIKEESLGELNGKRFGRKTIEYVCLPREAGKFKIYPSFVFFAPDSTKYQALGGEPFEIVVRQGSATSTAIISEDALPEEDIHFIKLNTRIGKAPKLWFGTIGFWILLVLPLLALAGAIFYKKRIQTLANIDPAVLKAQKAQKVALARLDQSANFLKDKNSRAFYDEVSKAMMGYVSDKLKIPKSELNKSNLQSRLEELEVAPERVNQFAEIIKNCEMALFAGLAKYEAMQDTYDHALQVLAEIEKQLAK